MGNTCKVDTRSVIQKGQTLNQVIHERIANGCRKGELPCQTTTTREPNETLYTLWDGNGQGWRSSLLVRSSVLATNDGGKYFRLRIIDTKTSPGREAEISIDSRSPTSCYPIICASARTSIQSLKHFFTDINIRTVRMRSFSPRSGTYYEGYRYCEEVRLVDTDFVKTLRDSLENYRTMASYSRADYLFLNSKVFGMLVLKYLKNPKQFSWKMQRRFDRKGEVLSTSFSYQLKVGKEMFTIVAGEYKNKYGCVLELRDSRNRTVAKYIAGEAFQDWCYSAVIKHRGIKYAHVLMNGLNEALSLKFRAVEEAKDRCCGNNNSCGKLPSNQVVVGRGR